MKTKKFTKDPDATLDYTVDWEVWLAGDTIATSQWTVPSGLTKASESNTTTTATAWISGGTVGQVYSIKNSIVSAGGRVNNQSLEITIVEK